jgi:beta-N-acetylhexosaminidase
MKYFLLPIILIIIFPLISSMETINLSEMSLEEKVGQLLIVRPTDLDQNYLDKLYVGGIFLSKQTTKEEYLEFVNFYKDNSKIDLFIAADMEGYWNPFSEFYESKSFGEINSSEEAYSLGKEQGKILNELGFNLDFSPVVEVRNNVWEGRSFIGTDEEISEKISKYIEGLHSEDIFATAKHYPGGNLVKNPHLIKFKVNATKQELNMFDVAINSKVDFVMVGHPVIYGELDSNGKQATISPEIIQPLKQNFDGLVITDAVTMIGLRISYLFNFKKVYPDLIRAGNNIILDTHVNSNYKKIKKRRDEILKQAKTDENLLKRIDESAKKILEKKGYEVV